MVVALGILYLNTENASSKKSAEEDSPTSRKPLPTASEDPHQSAEGKENDSNGDNGAREWGH